MHLIDKDPFKDLPKGAPNTGKGGASKTKALKNKIVDKASDVLSAPARAYHGAKSAVHKARYNHVVGNRNFKSRADDSNKYKSTSYWAKNKN